MIKESAPIIHLLSLEQEVPRLVHERMVEYERLRKFKPDPATPKHMAIMVLWARQMLNLYKQLRDKGMIEIGDWSLHEVMRV